LKQSALAFSIFAAGALTLAPARADEPKPFNGLYFGLHGGYAWQDASGVFDGLTNPTNLGAIDLDSAIVGAQLGYNLQYDWLLFGIEADATAQTDKSGSVTNSVSGERLSGQRSYLATIRSRLGVVIDQFLIYGTAGIAFTEFQLTETTPTFQGTLRLDGQTGGVYGGGVEWKVAYGVSLRGEYLHYDVGRSSYIPAGFPNTDAGDVVGYHDIDVARAGINISLGQ
jgi:outer membrane immunogenic protein